MIKIAGRKPVMTIEKSRRIDKIVDYLKSEKRLFTFVEINRHFDYPVTIRDDLRTLIQLGLIRKKKEDISRFVSFYSSSFKPSEISVINHRDKDQFIEDLKRILLGNQLRFLAIHSRLSKYTAKFTEQMIQELLKEKVIQCVIPPQYKGMKFPRIYKWSEII